VESLGVERSLTPVPIEKGRIANLSVGFVENDPFHEAADRDLRQPATSGRSPCRQEADHQSARPDPSVELAAPLAEPSGLDVVRSVLL
jgi:hypothetical protein